jgi:hypothetical protein
MMAEISASGPAGPSRLKNPIATAPPPGDESGPDGGFSQTVSSASGWLECMGKG